MTVANSILLLLSFCIKIIRQDFSGSEYSFELARIFLRAQLCSIALYIIVLQLGWMFKVSVCSRSTQTRGLPAEFSMKLQQPTSVVTEDFLQDFLDVYLPFSVKGILTFQVSSYYA